jgi:PPOX class probable F420-dependent enzyme
MTRPYVLMMTDPLASAPGWARSLLEEARVARLGLLDERGAPRVLPISFAIAAGALWTAVDSKPKRHPDREPARIGYVRSRSAVALTVDRYEDDWSRLAWAQVLGRALVVEAADAGPAMAALAAKYEQYREHAPPGPLIRVDATRLLCWRAG